MLPILDEFDGVFCICILYYGENRTKDLFLHDAVFFNYINHDSRFYLKSIFVIITSKYYFLFVYEGKNTVKVLLIYYLSVIRIT